MFFDDIWNTIKHTGEDIWNGAKDIASNGYNDIFRPVSKGIGQAGNKLVNTGADFVDKQSNVLTNFEGQLGNLVTNPIIWIGGIVVAIIVLPKIL
jgi:hypothetical protein